jgi:hypothetical protein
MPDSFAEILEKGFEHCRDMDAPLSARLEAFADLVRTLGPSFCRDSRSARASPPKQWSWKKRAARRRSNAAVSLVQ